MAAQAARAAAEAERRAALRANTSRPLVYLDVAIQGKPVGRMEFVLFAEEAPRAAENFRALCTCEKGSVPDTPGREGAGKPYCFKVRDSKRECIACQHTAVTLMRSCLCMRRLVFVSLQHLPASRSAGAQWQPKSLSFQGCMQGQAFYRIIDQFIDQSGAWTESIYGGHFKDDPGGLALRHDRPGLLSMANTGPDTNGSHFSIVVSPARHLDGKYTIFGEVRPCNVFDCFSATNDRLGAVGCTVDGCNICFWTCPSGFGSLLPPQPCQCGLTPLQPHCPAAWPQSSQLYCVSAMRSTSP